jgi:hypothetical protein
MMHVQHDAEDLEQAEHDLRALGGATRSPIDPGLTWLVVSGAVNLPPGRGPRTSTARSRVATSDRFRSIVAACSPVRRRHD